MRRLLVLLFFFIICFTSWAQLNPKPGAKINYTQIMFECERVKGADTYIFQIADDTVGKAFNTILLQQKDSSTATLINGLEFGKKYQWRFAGIKKGEAPVWKGPYRFEIAADSLLHYNLVSCIVTKNQTSANDGGLIINDCTHSIIDRNGNLIWYLPKILWHPVMNKKNLVLKPQIYDLRLNPSGTITYLADSIAVETDLNGNRLWKAPNNGKVSGSSSESYNHDFKRLPNGHYMVLGNELWRKLPPYTDTATVIKKYPVRKQVKGIEYGQVEFPLVIEYDKKGNVVWSWNSENYFDPDPLAPKPDTLKFPYQLIPHVNAFSVDKKNEFVYVGFRNISRIIKIEKKTEEVAGSWGNPSSCNLPANFVGFNQQHDANILDDGTIAVFNNNDYPGLDSFASVMIVSPKVLDNSNNNIAWQFACDFDSLDRHADRNGGNVDELKNGNFLVCMGNMNRIFEVTREKKIIWNANLKPNNKAGINFFHRLYRAHYVSSLYPCYFTFDVAEDTVSAGAPYLHIKIFNTGSESDSYEVRINSSLGNKLANYNTTCLQAHTSNAFEIKSERRVKPGELIEIAVSSKANPDFRRSVLVPVQK